MIEEKFVFAEQSLSMKNDQELEPNTKAFGCSSAGFAELLLLDLHRFSWNRRLKGQTDSVYFTYQIEPLGLSKKRLKSARFLSGFVWLSMCLPRSGCGIAGYFCHICNLFVPRMRRLGLLIAGSQHHDTSKLFLRRTFLRQAKCFAVTLSADGLYGTCKGSLGLKLCQTS